MEQEGWLAASWRRSEKGRRAKYHAMTPRGRAQLPAERKIWERLTRGVGMTSARSRASHPPRQRITSLNGSTVRAYSQSRLAEDVTAFAGVGVLERLPSAELWDTTCSVGCADANRRGCGESRNSRRRCVGHRHPVATEVA